MTAPCNKRVLPELRALGGTLSLSELTAGAARYHTGTGTQNFSRWDESHIQGTSKRPSKRIEGLSVLDAHHFLSDNRPSSASDTGLCELVVARYV